MTSVRIDNVNFPVSLPFSVCKTHEGGLDQAAVTLRHTTVNEPFEPYTRAYFEGEWWVITNDRCVHEKYINKYTHEIQLVELAKELEGVVCGAKTFTDPVSQKEISVQVSAKNYEVESDGVCEVEAVPEYLSPVSESFRILPIKWKIPFILGMTNTYGGCRIYTSVDNSEWIERHLDDIITVGEDVEIKVKYNAFVYSVGPTEGSVPVLVSDTTVIFTFESYKKHMIESFTRGSLTIHDVTERLLITAEPTTDESQRRFFHWAPQLGFYHPEAINTKLIDAPELSFANSATLKENLDQIAKILHAKTKLTICDEKACVFFVPLTTPTVEQINGAEISNEATFDIAKYGGRVETNAVNMSFKNNFASEPLGKRTTIATIFPKTIRAKDTEARITDTTGEIETYFPIKRVTKLLAIFKYEGEIKTVDISDYVYEESVYTTLSSYSGGRSFSLYYTRGSKNIKGLFFKQENAISETLERYSILNVLESVDAEHPFNAEFGYHKLSFFVEYEPYVDLRLVNSRTDGKGTNISYVANQSAQEMDKDALAAFVQGTAQEMSAASRKKTFLFAKGVTLPRVGYLYRDDTYISEITYERHPYYTKATLSLSEKFNQLGQYVEVPNAVREWEISTKNISNRNVLYSDICTISKNHPIDVFEGNKAIIAPEAWQSLIDIYGDQQAFYTAGKDVRVSQAVVKTYFAPHEANELPAISNSQKINTLLLPVFSFSFGNSLAFSVFFEDNYSAGRSAISRGSFALQEYVPYCDNYGCAEYLDVILSSGISPTASTDLVSFGHRLPKYPLSSHLKTIEPGTECMRAEKIHLFKDSRERIIFTYQLLFESDCDLIIGNDFASICPLVRDYSDKTDDKPVLHLYKHKIDPILGTIEEGAYKYEHGFSSYADGTPCIKCSIDDDWANYGGHKAWAYIWQGKFLFGANYPIKDGDTFYFNFHHK